MTWGEPVPLLDRLIAAQWLALHTPPDEAQRLADEYLDRRDNPPQRELLKDSNHA